ncbi:hypothetical protein LCGC14_2785660, partial [marine sediment metagenome]
TLPTIDILLGNTFEIHNLAAAQKITMESSDGDDIATFQDGGMTLMALQNTPTDRTHWRILKVVGGASPTFSVHRSSNQTISTTAATKIEWNAEDVDNNSNFDIATNHRFTPTVPGNYLFVIIVRWGSVTTAEAISMLLQKNGVGIYTSSGAADDAANPGNPGSHISIIVDMNGTTDYVEVQSDSTVDSSYDILGSSNRVSNFSGLRVP